MLPAIHIPDIHRKTFVVPLAGAGHVLGLIWLAGIVQGAGGADASFLGHVSAFAAWG